MSLGKFQIDRMKGVDRQKGCAGGWFLTLARCPLCKRNMWSNKKDLHCPNCNIYREIKYDK